MQHDSQKQLVFGANKSTERGQSEKEFGGTEIVSDVQSQKLNMATIIIPTYNRPGRLKRLLSYFNNCKVGSRIIIADSSITESRKKNKEIVSLFSGMDILYLDHFDTKVIGWTKWGEAIGRSQSKYTVICADDDFIVPKCINEAVNFLEENPSFILAHGKYFSFEIKKELEGNIQYLWRPIYPHRTIGFNDPKERELFHFANFYPTLFAVHRTEVLKNIFEQTKIYSLDNGHIGELFCSVLSLIYGKAKSLDGLYSARETISGSYSKVYKDFDILMHEESFKARYDKFKRGLVLHLSQEANVSEEEAGKIIDQGMKSYLKKYYTSLGSKLKNKVRRLNLPFRLNDKARLLYIKLLNAKNSKSYLEILANDIDFQKIRNAVLNSEK